MNTTKPIHKSKVILTGLVLLITNLTEWVIPHLPELQQIVTNLQLPEELKYWVNMGLAGLVMYWRHKSTTITTLPGSKPGEDGETAY